MVLEMQQKRILYIDSIYNPERGLKIGNLLKLCIFKAYKKIYAEEMSIIDKSKWKIELVVASQQSNSYDCGMLTGANAYCLIRGLSITTFQTSDMKDLRMQLTNRILENGKK
jgi:Ulp1 family protease